MSNPNDLVGMTNSLINQASDFFRRQNIQTYIWDLIRVISYPNLWVKALMWRVSKKEKPIRVHLGCGSRYVPHWINIDGKPFLIKKDMWLDLRSGLPFADAEVDQIYCSHVLEHLHLRETKKILRECRRVLRPGGTLRICVPSISVLIDAYQKTKTNFFSENIHTVDGQHVPRSLGGQFSFLTLQDGAHKSLFDKDFLMEILQDTGFSDFEELEFRKSRAMDRDDLIHLEGSEVRDISFYLEARK
jgi:predicted SAM-dependent methyltransferase